MKRLIYVAALSALVLASCAKSEPVPNADDAIKFSAYSSKTTRGTVADINTLKAAEGKMGGFGIFGFYTNTDSWKGTDEKPTYMYNQKVMWNGATVDEGSWYYTPLKYWPNTLDDKITFFAYAPYRTTANLNAGTDGIEFDAVAAMEGWPTMAFVIKPQPADMIDLLYSNRAETQDVVKRTTPVMFQFDHALTRVNLYAKVNKDLAAEFNNGHGNTRVFVREVKIDETSQKMYRGGIFYFEDGAWRYPDVLTHADYDLRGTAADNAGSILNYRKHNDAEGYNWPTFYAASYNKEGADGEKFDVIPLYRNGLATPLFKSGEYAFLIPVDNAHGANNDKGITDPTDMILEVQYDIVTIDPELENGYSIASTTEYVSLPNGTLKQGTAYRFDLTIGLEGIEVDAKVTDWGNEEQFAAPSTEVNPTDGVLANPEFSWGIDQLDKAKGQDVNCNYFVMNVHGKPTDIVRLGYMATTNFVSGDIIEINLLNGVQQVPNSYNVLGDWYFYNITDWDILGVATDENGTRCRYAAPSDNAIKFYIRKK